MTGLEVAVGFMIAWFVRRAKHVGERIDGKIDDALTKGLNKLHNVVVGKLGGDPALAVLEGEVVETGEATTRSQARVRLALEDAVEKSEAFAAELADAIKEIQAAQSGSGPVSSDQSVAITGDLSATSGGITIGGVTGGSVNVDRPDPSGPART